MKITGKGIKNNVHDDESPRLFYGRPVPRTWIMVIDRKKAQIFCKQAQDLVLLARAEPDEDERGPDLSVRESSVPARMGQLRHEEEHFSIALSRWLEELYMQDRFDRLVLVAAPQMLGHMRKNLHDGLHGKIIGEIAKDMTNLSVREIRRNLSNVVYFNDRESGAERRKSAISS